MADKFEDLRNYVAVVDSGGINAAAAALGIAKSAVSRRLSDLEERLGTKLINRSTRRFEPTAVGRHYYDSAKRLLDDLAALDAGFSEETSAPRETLTIAVDLSLAPLAAAAVAAFSRSDAGAHIRIVDGTTAGEDADLWLGIAPADLGKFQRMDAGSSALVIVGSPSALDRGGRPTSTAELRDHAGVAISSRAGSGWTFANEGDRPPVIVLTVPDDASAAAAAIAGVGVARLPLHTVESAIARRDLERLMVGSERPDPIGMWTRTGASVAVRRVADLLATALSS